MPQPDYVMCEGGVELTYSQAPGFVSINFTKTPNISFYCNVSETCNEAWVGGVKIEKTGYGFMSINVAPGTKHVELRYVDKYFGLQVFSACLTA